MTESATRAAQALRHLDRLAAELLQSLERSAPSDPSIGDIQVEEKIIRTTCLGRKLHCESRPVVDSKGDPNAVEYAFRVEWRGQLHLVRTYYLHGNQSLFRDVAGQEHFCQPYNGMLRWTWLEDLAIGLLASPLFAPAGHEPIEASPCP